MSIIDTRFYREKKAGKDYRSGWSKSKKSSSYYTKIIFHDQKYYDEDMTIMSNMDKSVGTMRKRIDDARKYLQRNPNDMHQNVAKVLDSLKVRYIHYAPVVYNGVIEFIDFLPPLPEKSYRIGSNR